MAKLRVYELAEQMNKTNKEILSILKDKGIEVASHMSTLSDEQIDAVKSEKTSEDTPKKKNIVQVFRPQNSQGGGRGRNGQGRPQGSRNGQRPQGNGNGQGRSQGNGNAHRMVTARDARREMARDVRRTETDRNARRVMEMARDVRRTETDRIVRREKTVITDSAEIQTDQETVRIRDRDARVMEEEMADSRTAETEEIIEITVITETEERCVMADAVTTEENPARLFRHLQSQNRNQAAINQKMRTRRKNITEMKRTKTDCRKAKRAKTITLSRKW